MEINILKLYLILSIYIKYQKGLRVNNGSVLFFIYYHNICDLYIIIIIIINVKNACNLYLFVQ